MKCIKSGLVYRNPKPHIKSIQAYMPSLVKYSDGEMVCTVRLGEAFQAHNLRAYVLRSKDDGNSWDMEDTLYEGTPDRPTTDNARIALDVDEKCLAAFIIRQDRKRKEMGLTNELTQGYVEQELMISKSYDRGKIWSRPRIFEPPLLGPCFEMCGSILTLSDKWLLPTSTWPDWDGNCPNGHKMVAFVSYDKGETWPEYVDVMANSREEITFWESRIIQLKDNRLLATAWAYDRRNMCDRPNQYVISIDSGKTFSSPKSTGILAQTLNPITMSDGRIFSVYRRMDKPGLWASISRIEDEQWINEEELWLWGNDPHLVSSDENMVKNFEVLKFGFPSLVQLNDGTVFITFWGVEDCVSNVRWFKVQLQSGFIQ